MPDLAIETRDLTKSYGTTKALNGFSLRVERGQVAGFLGPNGSGKSTTIRILLGMLRADAGSAQVLGLDPWVDAVAIHRRIAYVAGDTSLWPNLTGGEVIDVLTNSVATTGERGSSKSGLRSVTQNECTSPPSTTGFAGLRWPMCSSRRRRATG